MKNMRTFRTIAFPLVSIMSLLMVVATSCQQAPLPPVEEHTGAVSSVNHPEWSKSASLYEVNVRQYTPEGTFNAFASHLPRLKNMGVDILWFMPVTPIGTTNRKGTLGSYYSVANYTAVNPEYGTMDDFKNLVEEIHNQDMHVIIDWVANHTAWNHPWVTEHPEFYHKDDDGNFTPPYNTDWTDVVQLEYENRELWDAMAADMKFWVEEIGVDGFRCDVAYLVPVEFWNFARTELEKVKPVFLLAEADHPELNQFAFNAGYSWTSHHAMNRIARGEDNVASLNKYFFDEKMGNYPLGAYKVLFIDNHDENSWAGTVFERLGDGMEAFAVLNHTAPGMPLIYSGQEAGLNKRLSFFEKDSISWNELPYEDFFKKLLELKESNPALWNGIAGGSMTRIPTNSDESVFAFLRAKDKSRVFVVLNLSDETRQVSFTNSVYIPGVYTGLFTGERERIGKNFTLEMEPWGYSVFYR